MHKKMKLAFVLLLLLVLVGFKPMSYAELVSYDGGAIGNQLLKQGTFEYTEICFVSGEPVVLTGTVTLPTTTNSNSDKYTVTYSFDLSNTDKAITLSRKATYNVVVTKDTALSQTTTQMTLTKLDEKYVVGSATYSLARYTFSQGMLTDNTPAVDYFNGNQYIERVFYRNGSAVKNEGTLTIVSNAETIVGYKHKWGSSESRIINQRYDFVPPTTSTTTATKWSGTSRISLSSLNRKSFQYMGNEPQNISFRGSYIMKDNQENVLKYSYDMPSISNSTISDNTRTQNTKSIKNNVVVGTTSLIAPKIRDIGGYWSEKDIFLMASLKIFDESEKVAVPGNFSPSSPITRMDFAKAIARAIGDVKALTKDEIIKRARPGVVKTISYQDIDNQNPDISYIEFLDSRHVMVGEGQYFYPDRPIKRSEAVSIMISALGLNDLAPQPPFKTSFKDDAKIPDWAKGAIYAANEVGLITAYKDGTFKPDNTLPRGEAAAMVAKMVQHLREKITADYREKILSQ